MNIRLISITSFAIMFLAVAFMPFHLAMVVVFGVFCILISCGAVYACRKIYVDNNTDIFDKEFISIDDLARHMRKHPDRPVKISTDDIVKIDEHC